MKKLLSILLFSVIYFVSRASEVSCVATSCKEYKVSSIEKGTKGSKFTCKMKAYEDLPENELYWLEEPKSFEECKKNVFIKGRFDAPKIEGVDIIVWTHIHFAHVE